MKAQVELFRAFLIRCPHCGGDIHYRLNLDGPHCGNYGCCRCHSCKEIVTRRELLWARFGGRPSRAFRSTAISAVERVFSSARLVRADSAATSD